jgi:hypothetical protein
MAKDNIRSYPSDPLSYPLIEYPFVFIDYLWVITVYIIASFAMSVIIDGHIVPPFDIEKESKDSSIILSLKIILQLAIQGFIAILLCAILQKVPSPVEGVYGYYTKSPLGLLVRNPAIISVILFALSSSLRARLFYLFSRYDKNAPKKYSEIKKD